MQKIVEVPGVGNVEFPDSMSDTEIGAVIQRQHPELSKGVSPSLLASRQAASKSAFEANRPESTIGSRAREAATGVLEPFTAESVTNTAKAAGSALWDALRGRGTAKAQELVNGLITAPIRPVQNVIEGIQSGDYDKAAYGAGGILSQTVPAVAGVGEAAGTIAKGVRGAIPAGTAQAFADSMKMRAMANREPLPALTPADVARDALTTATAGVTLGPVAAGVVEGANLLRRTKLYRGAKAAVQDKLAAQIAGPQGASGNLVIGPDELAIPKDQPVILNQAQRRANSQVPETNAPIEEPSPAPLSIPRPSAPQFIQDALDRMRQAETPEQLYERQQAQRNQEFPEPTSEPYTQPSVQRPTSPRPGLWDEIMGTQAPKDLPPDAPSINKWMGIRPEEVIRGANPGQRILDEGLLGETKEATQSNVNSALESAAQDMKAKLKASTERGVKIDAQVPVYDAWAKVEKRIGRPQDSSFQAQIQGVVDDIEAKYPDLAKLTPEQTHALKVDLGDSINWKGTGFDEPVNQMMVQIYRDLNSAIKSNVEGIGPAQARWGDLYISSKGLKSGLAKDVVGKGTGPMPAAGKTATEAIAARRGR